MKNVKLWMDRSLFEHTRYVKASTPIDNPMPTKPCVDCWNVDCCPYDLLLGYENWQAITKKAMTSGSRQGRVNKWLPTCFVDL